MVDRRSSRPSWAPPRLVADVPWLSQGVSSTADLPSLEGVPSLSRLNVSRDMVSDLTPLVLTASRRGFERASLLGLMQTAPQIALARIAPDAEAYRHAVHTAFGMNLRQALNSGTFNNWVSWRERALGLISTIFSSSFPQARSQQRRVAFV